MRKRTHDIVEALKELRRLRDWTQEQLARELDVCLATVQRWENGHFLPSRLASKFLDRLFEEEGIKVEETIRKRK